jgi:hypothetical protein
LREACAGIHAIRAVESPRDSIVRASRGEFVRSATSSAHLALGFLFRDGEPADRIVFFVAHLILLVVVVLLMRGSLISAHEVGLTADNRKSGQIRR